MNRETSETRMEYIAFTSIFGIMGGGASAIGHDIAVKHVHNPKMRNALVVGFGTTGFACIGSVALMFVIESGRQWKLWYAAHQR